MSGWNSQSPTATWLFVLSPLSVEERGPCLILRPTRPRKEMKWVSVTENYFYHPILKTSTCRPDSAQIAHRFSKSTTDGQQLYFTTQEGNIIYWRTPVKLFMESFSYLNRYEPVRSPMGIRSFRAYFLTLQYSLRTRTRQEFGDSLLFISLR